MSTRHRQTGVDGERSSAPRAQPSGRETMRRLTRRWAFVSRHATQGIGGRVCRCAMPSLVIVLSLVGVGCASSSHSASPAATSTTTAVQSPTATATTQTAAPPASTGSSSYGASEAAWDSTHTPDNSYPSGSAYDSDPLLPEVEGHAGARYTEVGREGGRIVAYKYHFPATAIAAARANVLHTQFPSDAHQVFFREFKPTCAFMLVRSDTVGRHLHAAGVGGAHAGEPKVVFTGGSEEEERSGSSYDASRVTVAYLAPTISTSPAQAEC
jgi:hypothetical protein